VKPHNPFFYLGETPPQAFHEVQSIRTAPAGDAGTGGASVTLTKLAYGAPRAASLRQNMLAP
jgi:hypothetical protein